MTRREVPDTVRQIVAGTSKRWRERGVTQRQLRTLVSQGELIRYRRGSFVTRTAVEWAKDNPRRQHVLHVYVAMGLIRGGAVPSHESAAVMHDMALLKDPGELVSLTIPAEKRRSGQERPGVVLHAADLPEGHLGRMYQVPVTSGPRTVVDLARKLPFMEAVVVADSALHLDRASRGELDVVLDHCKGWPGIGRAKKAIGFADPDAESPLESCGRVILHEHGIEPPLVQEAIHGEHYTYYADLCWPGRKTIVEFDGKVKYQDGKQETLDKQFERDRVLRDAGYQVIHVTWDELFDTPDVVIGRIRTAFAGGTAF